MSKGTKLSVILKETNTKEIAINYDGKSKDVPVNVVYLLIDGEQVVYIGKSTNNGFVGRYKMHLKDERKIFDNAVIIPIDGDGLAYQVEQGLICIYEPMYNRKYPPNPNKFIKIACNTLGMDFNEYLVDGVNPAFSIKRKSVTGVKIKQDGEKLTRIGEVVNKDSRTRKAIAKAANISPQALNALCSDSAQPSIKRLRQLADVLNCSIFDLLEPYGKSIGETNKSSLEQKIDAQTDIIKLLRDEIKEQTKVINEQRQAIDKLIKKMNL